MEVKLQLHDNNGDDEYIDIEVSSCICHSINSPAASNPREFEFQMSSLSLEKEPTTSPADELFYKGKLLPLHLPPRLQMVEKLLENSSSFRNDNYGEFYGTPLMNSSEINTPTSITSTPFESCNISPSESCRISREINPEKYFFEYGNEAGGFVGENPKKSWTKKLKMIKNSLLGPKLKSFFGKSGCSDDSRGAARKVGDEGTVSKDKDDQSLDLDKCFKAENRDPFGQIQKEKCQISETAIKKVRKQKTNQEDKSGHNLHRRSFSMAIKRHSTNKSSCSSSSSLSSSSSSSSSSNSSNSSTELRGLPFLRKSTSARSETENPIQGAIAHCKQSQQLFRPRKTFVLLLGVGVKPLGRPAQASSAK